MKVIISVTESDIRFLDAYAETRGYASRSNVVHKAIRLLQVSELGPAYEDAWTDWAKSEDGQLWDA